MRDQREDWRAGLVCAVIKNQNLPRGEISYEPADFFPSLPRIKRHVMSAEQMDQALTAFSQSTLKPATKE